MEENEKVKGIKISENWIIGSDAMNIVLWEFGNKYNVKTKEESFGLKKTTYHGNVEQALNYIINKEMFRCEFTDLQEVVDDVKEIRKSIENFKKITKVIGDDTIDKI